MKRRLFACLLACTAFSCAPALREAPPRPAPRPLPASATLDDLVAEARRAFAVRTVEGARLSSALWLSVARAAPERVEAWAERVRAQVWLAGHELHEEDRRESARAAVQAAQWCGEGPTRDARCDYWLAVALGVQAREHRATALDAVPRIVDLLETLVIRDPALEQGGPHRVLALLYLRAPGWPTGPGDPRVGLEHARRAVEIASDYPPNQLALAEALDKSGDPTAAREAAELAERLCLRSVERGDPDAVEWLDEARRRLGKRSCRPAGRIGRG